MYACSEFPTRGNGGSKKSPTLRQSSPSTLMHRCRRRNRRGESNTDARGTLRVLVLGSFWYPCVPVVSSGRVPNWAIWVTDVMSSSIFFVHPVATRLQDEYRGPVLHAAEQGRTFGPSWCDGRHAPPSSLIIRN